MDTVIYDAGALIAADRNERRFWVEHRVRLERGTLPVVPAVVVAQVSRAGKQAQLRRLLRGCEVSGLDEQTAHQIGACLAKASTTDVIDGAVVVDGVKRNAGIVTRDVEDIRALLTALNASLPIFQV